LSPRALPLPPLPHRPARPSLPHRPARPPPPPPDHQPAKHQADGLTRRSNLSLCPRLSSPLLIARAGSRSSSLLVPYPPRPFTPASLSAALSRAPHRPSFCILCHFAPPLVCVCRSLPCCPYPLPSASLFYLGLPLSLAPCIFCFGSSCSLSLSLSLSPLPRFRKSRQNSPQNDRRATRFSRMVRGKSGFSLDQRETEDTEMIKEARGRGGCHYGRSVNYCSERNSMTVF